MPDTLRDMTVRDALGPFQPGPGGMPPHLAGRESEQDYFRTVLRRLRDGVPLPSEVMLYGPRGNGKTVLLQWLRDEAASLGKIETVVLLPSGIPDESRLSELLLPKAWWDRLTPEQVGLAGFSWRPGSSGPPPPLEQGLAARARKAPLLVVMDEAHTLDIAVGRALLNACQEVRHRLPCLLILAGTPNLRGHLAAMDAAFWSRAQKLRIGRLNEVAAAEGLRYPYADAGIRVDEGALAHMVRLTHGYPYFIQLLGQKTWARLFAANRAGPTSGAVTAAVVRESTPDFENARRDYYLDRFTELQERDLLPAARSVAEVFQNAATVSSSTLQQAIGAGLGSAAAGEVRDAERVLADLGFVWGTSPTPGWEPGIPSLMDYVLEFAPAPAGCPRSSA